VKVAAIGEILLGDPKILTMTADNFAELLFE